MVEGWWCETSRGHFLRRCLNGRAAGARGGAGPRASVPVSWVFWLTSQLEVRA